MTGAFSERLPAFSDAELRACLARPRDYRAEALAAVLAECARRGLPVTDAERAAVQGALALRAAEGAGPDPHRMRRLARWTLILGLAAAALIYLTAHPPPPEPLGTDPLDTKRYLRELEVLGGKGNVLGLQFRQWFAGLWQGRALAGTVAALSGLLAALFRWLGREPRP